MRNHVNRLGGALAVVALVGAGVVALDVGPTVITDLDATTQTMWVPVDSRGEIVRVDTVSGDVTGRVEVAAPGHRLEVTETDDQLVVVDATVGSLVVVDPGVESVTRELQTGISGVEHFDGSPDGFVLAAGTDVALVDPEVTTVATVVAAAPVTSIAAVPEGAVVASAQGVATVGSDETRIWDREADAAVVVRAGDEVVWTDGRDIFDLDGRKRACIDGEAPVGARWSGSDGRVVATDSDDGVVHIVDLDNGRCRSARVADPGTTPVLGEAVVARGHVFVPEPASRTVHIVDLDSGQPPVSVRAALKGEALRLHVRDGLVIAHDPVSQVGSVLGDDRVVHYIDTSGEEGSLALSVVAGGDAAVPEEDDAALTDDGTPGLGDLGQASAGLTDAPILDDVDLVESPEEDIDESVLAARFAFSEDLVTVGDVVEFVDESTGGPTSWVWDFGDGSGAEGPEVSTSWSEAGTYTVTLFVSDGVSTAEETHPIVVVAAGTPIRPSANFDFSATVVDVGDSVQFTDTSTGQVDSRRWDFGDGTTSADAAPRKAWSSPGRFNVQLTVANEVGSSTASVEVRVVAGLEAPDARIVVGTTSVAVGERVEFAAGSAGGPASFGWDFGDGGKASGPAVGHVFTTPGTRTVTLTASNHAGRSVDTATIVVAARTLPPIARIAAVPSLIEVGQTIVLTSLSANTPDSLRWDFDDGSTGSGATVQHSWAAPGDYRVTLTAENGAGSDTTVATLRVVPELPEPVASFTVPGQVRVGVGATFVNTSSNATSSQWDFGGGATAATTDATHTFGTSGPHDVLLTVRNRNGADTVTRTVDVLPALPTADFSWSPLAPDAGESVSFIDLSSGAVSWEWDFGDGSLSASGSSPSHTFAAAVDYDVTLTVRNAVGEIASMTRTVSVDPPPPSAGSITANPGSGVTLQSATFSAPVTGGPVTSREWTVDGVIEGSGTTLTYTFPSAGTYVIGLRLVGPGGTAAAAPRSFTVVDPPPPVVTGVTVTPASPQTGQSVQLTATIGAGSGPIDRWQWRVDGAIVPGTGQSLSQAFSTTGQHSVQATAIGPVASASGPVRTFTVVAPPPDPPVLGAITGPAYANVGQTVTFGVPVVAGGAPTFTTWSYGDGASGPSPAHSYASPGSYTVSVTASNAGGSSNTPTRLITVVTAPVVTQPVPSVPNPIVGQGVTFTAQYGAATGPLNYQWSVDGVPVGSGASLPGYAFGAAGLHTVAVTATGPTGLSDSNSISITVDPPPPPTPIADFTWTPAAPTVGNVQFNNLSQHATVWMWNFGDGTTSTAQSPNHIYALPGSYNVTLTATGPGGSRSISKTVPVTLIP